MKLLGVLVLIAAACAAPSPQQSLAFDQQVSQGVQLLRYENENLGLNSYKFGYDLSDGTQRQEEGKLEDEGTKDEALVVKGSYIWISPEGTRYSVTFTADANGFQPRVEILPALGAGFSSPVIASLLG